MFHVFPWNKLLYKSTRKNFVLDDNDISKLLTASSSGSEVLRLFRWSKRGRQQSAHRSHQHGERWRLRHVHWRVTRREFGQHLTAHAARCGEKVFLLRDHSDRLEFPEALTHGLDDCRAFAANGRAIRRILDVAAGWNSSIRQTDRGSDFEIAVWTVGRETRSEKRIKTISECEPVGILPRLDGCFDQLLDVTACGCKKWNEYPCSRESDV